ncbi:hypothetical protein N0V82_000728 [Gnomoniopsis sp. IMI 355080]|nr:hypothetical protein N0V82_000728 [Gnomoniopsis sp. IMI 355080]
MAPSAQAHRRSHSLLLFQKLLNLRDSASPLTLVLDTLEQSATPVVQEFINRAKIAHTKIIFISFSTIKKPSHADIFIKARSKSLQKLRSEIVSHYPTPVTATAKDAAASQNIPLPIQPSALGEYEPHPLTVLNHLATAVLRVSSHYQTLERRRAQNRSLPEPDFGLDEGREGVLIGLNNVRTDGLAVVVEMELRRRSGRAVVERFVISSSSSSREGAITANLSLLSDHPLFAAPDESGGGEDEELADTTFSLGLTEKQRKDRDGIVLPYFDAQEDVGGGEGGRILYDMGREDDFDDEEDEI